METNDRIAQWEHMTQEDAKNPMGWFSLGNAYRDAGRLPDADKALAQCLELDPGSSRAWQLRGQVLIALGRNDEAGAVLTRGYSMAAQKGDVMPQKAMGSLLEKLGKPVPEIKEQSGGAAAVLPQDAIVDRKTGQPGTRMKDAPMRGPTGAFIKDHFSQETWREWIRTGTKVINELRLDFSNPADAQVYDLHMLEWLGISEEEVAAYAGEMKAKG